MKSKLLAAIVVLLFVACLFQACNRPSQNQEFRIGAVLPLTGPGAPFGESSKNALILAQEELSAHSTNSPVRVLIEDGMTDARSSVSAFNHLLDVERCRVFITSVSSVSLALAPLADQKSVLLFANASHPDITKDHKFVLRYSNIASQEAGTMIDFIKGQQPPWSNIYLIALNDDYGRAYAQQIAVLVGQQAEFVVKGEEFYDRNTTDFRTIASKAIAANPDAIVLVGFGRSMGLCIRQLRELGYQRPFVASLGFVLNNDAVVAAGDAAKGGFFLNFAFVTQPGAKEFRRRYQDRFGSDPSPNAVIDYGTLYLLAKGINAVGNDPEKLANYFRTLGKAQLPTGEVSISASGDITAPVIVTPISPFGTVNLWDAAP
ncbi:MAG: amino acid ABC transporter substrate-binding protein [Verrucomicrobia bacterium]|nr:MAG: amino acid ABC transporter substrate-binding protein [Verrucomicrobiota bacterium]